MDLPRVLLLGPRGVGKRALASQITGRQVAPGDQADGQAVWDVDTKYYTAQVLVEVHHLEDVSDSPQGDWGGYEAVVLVFGCHAGFGRLREWWGAAGGGEGFEVKLALAATSCGPPRPAWLAEAGEWCLSELVELVEEEDGGGGTAGVERVKEALHAHMWPGLALKPRERGQQSGSAAGPSAECAAAGLARKDLGAAERSSEGATTGLLPEQEDDDELGRLFADISGEREQHLWPHK
jgi:hypothetical protein